ncbi:MAG: ABC-F family ATP-binding cassette domain-containing protein [Pseudomonadota bacterium]|jgi:ATP-binding cassette subfamily F protein 3|nr:ATP-binding cassette domain-containing protein [Rubrivivax sp.]MCA3258896.1 ATP-binding cassette domain-containing protein [Rubrivivax sp.]MCZ8032508.1 ATP-binding cassette domain-containing protein [Rubrivivax sp.]
MITVRDLVLRRGGRAVLDGASFVLNPGEHAGLVGRNGAGKSTLFAALAGRLHPDGGDIEVPPRWRLGEVAQHMPEESTGATDYVLAGDLPLAAARHALAEAEAADDGHAIAVAHVALEEAGAFDARPRAQALLLGLGFGAAQLDAPVDSFSGGWRMRLQLARALLCPSDLLLLDEPTNHLDLDALVWLEGWLQRYAGTLVVISHDREFLDAVTRVTLHVDQGRVQRYGGNYTAFETMRAERLAQAAAAFARQQERIANLQRFIDRFRAKATKARQAQSRVKALERMERLAPVLTESEFDFEFREPASLPNPMLVLDDVGCGYRTSGGELSIVRHASRTVLAGQRIGILGANGQGKSTLVKTIAGVLPPLAGRLTEGKGLAIGYFAQQEMDLLAADDTPLQLMTRLARESGVAGRDAREQDLRNFLGQFRFDGDMVLRRVGTLSGGERARLVLATIVWRRPNLVLLDEPTNHLDLATREALSIALNEFEGTVLLVSHDRALLREVCDEFWLVTRGGVEPFDGDLDDYQRWLQEVSRAVARGAEPPPPYAALRPAAAAVAPTPSPAPARAAPSSPAAPGAAPRRDDRKAAAQARAERAQRTRPLRSELRDVDAQLERLASERRDVEAALAEGRVPVAGMADAGRRLNHVAAEIAMLEERWLEIQAQLEALGAAE